MNNILKQLLTALRRFGKPGIPPYNLQISFEEAEDIAYDWLIQDALGG